MKLSKSSKTAVRPKANKMVEQQELDKQYGGNYAGGWLSYLPVSWVPYIQLARLSPPAGLFLIYFPHLFGIAHEATVRSVRFQDFLQACAVMLCGSFFVSNTIHIWNDLVDAPIDKQVARTRHRPIPRGAVTPFAAFVFTVTQAACAAMVLFAFLPARASYYAALNLAPTTYYPWAKRHTHFSQFVLGVWLAWGVVMGSASFTTGSPGEERAVAYFGISQSTTCLFVACILWTVIYDTIYAHQDIEDDTKIGMKSLAVLCRERTKPFLYFVLLGLLLLLMAVGGLFRNHDTQG
ncbi:UbiA prenyltransferase family-domain-containing protein [Xylariaceae sp. FL1272]|nr:UbiA prenyltransferase family-domain-containing protein [Xylariaceae sp. FL1272]